MTDPRRPESLHAEHQRLLSEVEALRREHADLERRPFDAVEHAQHIDKLRKEVTELRAHAERIRRSKPESHKQD